MPTNSNYPYPYPPSANIADWYPTTQTYPTTQIYPTTQTYGGSGQQTIGGSVYYNPSIFDYQYYNNDFGLSIQISLYLSNVFSKGEFSTKPLERICIDYIKNYLKTCNDLATAISSLEYSIATHYPFLSAFFTEFKKNKLDAYLAIL